MQRKNKGKNTAYPIESHDISRKTFLKLKSFHRDTCALTIVLIKETWIVSFSSKLKCNVIPGL